MAIAGRSYANVPVIVRGTLQDPPVLTTPPPVVVAAAPDWRWFAGNLGTVTILRSTLQDPPVLTTAAPVVVAAAADRRWFAGAAIQVAANPQAPAVIPVATPGPVVVTSQPPVLPAVPAFITRNTLADPPVLTTASPVVIAAPSDRRWYNSKPVTVIGNAQAPPAVFTATPGPVVVTAGFPWPRTVQAFVTRSTLAGPPALTTPGPVVTAAPADRRWFSARPATVITGRPAAAPPSASSPGLLMAMGM